MSRFKKLKDINIEKDMGELFDIRVVRVYKGLTEEYKNAILLDCNEIEYFFLISNAVMTFKTKYSTKYSLVKKEIYVKYSVKVQ